jgi:hypothetical protein
LANENESRSSILPADQFDILLGTLIGHPNGGHTPAAVVQDIDFYNNSTQYIVQTVRTEKGSTVFLTQVNSAGSARYILPPKVLALIDRQRDTTTTQIRRRHGKRLAAERAANGQQPTFTPEMRRKAQATRKRNAARKKKGGRA